MIKAPSPGGGRYALHNWDYLFNPLLLPTYYTQHCCVTQAHSGLVFLSLKPGIAVIHAHVCPLECRHWIHAQALVALVQVAHDQEETPTEGQGEQRPLAPCS